MDLCEIAEDQTVAPGSVGASKLKGVEKRQDFDSIRLPEVPRAESDAALEPIVFSQRPSSTTAQTTAELRDLEQSFNLMVSLRKSEHMGYITDADVRHYRIWSAWKHMYAQDFSPFEEWPVDVDMPEDREYVHHRPRPSATTSERKSQHRACSSPRKHWPRLLSL